MPRRKGQNVLQEHPSAKDVHGPPTVGETGPVAKQLRFGVGNANGPRSITWTLKANKNDVYLMQRRVGRDMKVSFHEAPALWRVALTSEHLTKPNRLQVPAGKDPRLATEWLRPPADAASGLTRAFAIVIPWFEVRDRPAAEPGDVVWADPPPQGSSVEFDIFFAAPAAIVNGHPGAHSMDTRAVGDFTLPNGERVFVVWWTPQITQAIQQQLDDFLSREVLQAGQPVSGLGMLGFGIENGVGVHLDLTVPDVAEFARAAFVRGEARCPRCGEVVGTQEDRAKILAAVSAGKPAGVPVRHLLCGQYFRARLVDRVPP